MVLLVTIHGLNREKAYAERFDKSRYSMRAFRGAWRGDSFTGLPIAEAERD